MRLTALIAKGEVGQAGADFGAQGFNVDWCARSAGLGLTSLPNTNHEQGQAQDQGVSSTTEQIAHGGRSLPACDDTHRSAIYSRPDCLRGVVCRTAAVKCAGPKNHHQTARYDDIMDRRAWRRNREATGAPL